MTFDRPDAIISDLDNSLLQPWNKGVGKRDAAAIRRMTQLGIPVLPGTGRPPIRVKDLVRELGLELALCSNGGCCYDFGRQETLFVETVAPRVAKRLVEYLLEQKILFIIHTPTYSFRAPGAEVLPRYDGRCAEERFMLGPDTPVESLQVLKVLAVECDDKAVMARPREMFSPDELSFSISEPRFVDCGPPAVDKGSGLRRLAELKGWRLENILVMGDYYNDQTMLEAAGKSAVPASGAEELKAKAGFIAPPCGEDPLSAAIDHFYPGLLEGI